MTTQVESNTTKTSQGKYQETFKPVTQIFTVKNVIFRTNNLGKVFPLIELCKNKVLKQRDTDAIMFDNIGTLYANNVGIGSRLKIRFDSNNVPEVKGVIRAAKTVVAVPTNCNVCGKPYTQHEDRELYCHNVYCPATARGFLYKLFTLAIPAIKTERVTAFLNEFPVGGVSGSLDSFSEFQYIWESIKDRHTAGREQKWVNIHGDLLGEQLSDIERDLSNFLDASISRSIHFWHICNFPKIDDEVFYELANLNPKELINGEIKEEYLALSHQARTFVDHNLDFIDWLVNFFDKFGETTWIE